jgi:hypothetical protein
MTTLTLPDTVPDAPYRGIEPFRYVDKDVFFAREGVTRRLLRRVVVYRGVMLYGDSGTGKSSLVNAGLAPAALDEGYHAERVRVQPRPGEEFVVERLTARTEPLEYLPSALVHGDLPRRVFSVSELRTALDTAAREHPDHNPLLVFDQFEELVTLFEEASVSQRRTGKDTQQKIVELIGELLADDARPIKVLFVFREDYLAKIADLLCAHPEVLDRYVRVTYPSADAIPEIVQGPFKKFPGHFGRELGPEIAERLSSLMDERAGGAGISLSELQIICLRLWKDENPEKLLTRNGLQGILEDHFSGALEGMDADVRYAAVALLGRMVTRSGARNVVSEDDLITHVRNEDGVPSTTLKKALRALREDSRLIRREVRHEVAFYEIVSEFLAPWIRAKREQLRTSDPLPSLRARWKRELDRSEELLDGENDEQRRDGVRALVSLLIQSRGLGEDVYDIAMRRLYQLRDDTSLAVFKDAEKGLRAVHAMQDDEWAIWVPSRVPASRHLAASTPTALASDTPAPATGYWLRLAGLFLIWSLVSALAIGWGIDTLDLAGLGGLPASWTIVALVSAILWTLLYMAEAADSLPSKTARSAAPLHPWSWADSLLELSSAWPLNFILTWLGGYGFAVAAHALGLDWSLAFPLSFGIATVGGGFVYAETVVLL